MKATPKVLFITRKYPPSTGGMENFMHGLISNYPGAKRVIAYGGSQKWLPFVYVWHFFYACGMLISDSQIEIIHAGDGVMAPMVWLLKKIFRKKSTLTTYGKDVNLQSKIYQFLIPPFMRQMDYVFPISNQTRIETLNRGICSQSECEIVTPGVNVEDFVPIVDPEFVKRSLIEKYKIDLRGRKILLTVGRLSKRKGVEWFSKNVMPLLKDEFVYISIGADGTEINGVTSMLGIQKISYREEILGLLGHDGLLDSVYLLGKLPFEDVKGFYAIADVFLMPNISVPGDMEGFGIVNIEAGLMGTPVVASKIEGIPDAVIDGITGSLVEEGKVDDFVEKITAYIEDPPDRNYLRKIVMENYSWESLSHKYFERFTKILRSSRKSSILYIFPFFTGPYGAERLLSNLVNGVYAKNTFKKVSILTIAPSDVMMIDQNISVKSLLKPHTYKHLGHDLMTLLSPFVLSLQVIFTKLRDVKVIHLMNWQSMLVAPLIKMKNRNCYVLYHCTEPPRFLYDLREESIGSKKGLFKVFFMVYSKAIQIWDKFSIKKIDKIISISEWTEDQVQKIYKRDSEVIYPAVETQRFDSLDKTQSRKVLGLDLDQTIYTTVSKMHPRKKIDESIDLFRKHSKGDLNSKYFLIGGGPDIDRLKGIVLRLGDDRIEILGRVESDEKVAQYIVSSDYFIFTAKNEPFGIAPLEAKYAGAQILGVDLGRPVITTEELVNEFNDVYKKI